MRLLPALAAGALVVVAAAVPAHAEPPHCGFFSWGSNGTQEGFVWGGPVDPTHVLTCTIQVGTNDTHAEADAATVTAQGTVPPTPVSYEADDNDDVYLCTMRRLPSGTTLYWDAVNLVWSTSATTACRLAVSLRTPSGTFHWVP